MIKIINVLGLAVGFAIANFGFQFFTKQNYWKAFEHTFYQWSALGMVILSMVLCK